MKRFLITTSDTRTWDKSRPILFLGEWCRLYMRRLDWESLDAEVVPYHWDDRDKYYEDYIYLQNLYEQALQNTSEALNRIHGTDHSLRYWRILIGPWLYTFIHILFDRWTMIKQATSAYEIDGTTILDFPPGSTIPASLRTMDHDSVSWNHYLFAWAIKHQNNIPWKEIPALERCLSDSTGGSTGPVRFLQAHARTLLSSALGLFTSSREAMIIDSYLPKSEEMKLQILLGQVPKMWKPPQLNAFPPNFSLRARLRIRMDGKEEFHHFLSSMIPEQIPTVHLEGYRNLEKVVARLPWPSKPKVIFTSNLFSFCEVFQAWMAAKAEIGCPVVLGQHGGVIGTAKWLPGGDHQVQVSDRYLSWGWRNGWPHVHPAAVFTNVNKPVSTWNPKGHLVLLTMPMRMYSYRNSSLPVGPNQSVNFINDQLRFARALNEPIRMTMLFRINKALDNKMHTFYVERWQDAFPDTEIDDSTEPIEFRLRQSRLAVYTYNSTGFLETLGRNIPTVVFWNPTYFELCPDAQPYFDRLKEAGIYHETPESAATHVKQVWNDVAGWWNQAAVQEVRQSFCERYSRMPLRPLHEIKEHLTNVMPRHLPPRTDGISIR